MEEEKRDKKIYKYIFPCGRIYIGQTNQSMNRRWGSQGSGYINCKDVYPVIQYYISKNPKFKPKVKILKINLTQEEANYWEKYYIAYYRETLGWEIVLNDQDGGIGNKKKVCQYSYDGLTLLNKYESIEEAALATNTRADHIGHCLRKPWRNYTAGGFRWYYDDGKIHPLIYYPIYENKAKPVKQIDINTGKIVAIYESIKAAAKATGICKRAIQDCINKPETAHSANGFAWQLDDGKIHPIIQLTKKVPVIQRDKNTREIIAKYSSVSEASAATGISATNISTCINGRQKTTGGYIFEKEL